MSWENETSFSFSGGAPNAYNPPLSEDGTLQVDAPLQAAAEPTIVHATIQLPRGKGPGITLRKSKDASGVYRVMINALSGLAAALGTIEEGMHVRQIDGTDTSDSTVSQCKKLLRKAKGEVTLKLFDPRVQIELDAAGRSERKAQQNEAAIVSLIAPLASPPAPLPKKNESVKATDDDLVVAYFSEMLRRIGNVRVQNNRDRTANVTLTFQGLNSEFPQGRTVALTLQSGECSPATSYISRVDTAEEWTWDFKITADSSRMARQLRHSFQPTCSSAMCHPTRTV